MDTPENMLYHFQQGLWGGGNGAKKWGFEGLKIQEYTLDKQFWVKSIYERHGCVFVKAFQGQYNGDIWLISAL